MGSECPTSITIHVTGFKKFHGVPHNPTETIVSNLKQFLKRRSLIKPERFTLGSCTVLEAAADGVFPFLESTVSGPTSSNHEQVIWLHFGANGGSSKFALEYQAVNEASFLFPDEHGWQPQQVPIVPEDGGIYQKRQTTCPIEMIVKHLKQKEFDVSISSDADRFLCNYIYYHSLRLAEQKGYKSFFVHVPLFSRIDEDIQMEFAASLLEALALTC
ncbi:Peptidase C15, pyroglutamyl peptidase I-like protein [Thalictrum thalictroides]|uniref:Peptidase C15, pyroglutamyl peptidase I-like protein n=1 Tax=Thalictrum thalictroides TaxID=46969 RepID=A0A7J6WLR4_THATH|nr:Peptidase C15, pyroglutamyl peptidase I-like protein [Thalictrum thalictroides]